MNWTQPSCLDCWNRNNPGRAAHVMVAEHAQLERCSWCWTETRSGIYVRADPATVPFPAPDADE